MMVARTVGEDELKMNQRDILAWAQPQMTLI
jgi:hypothetical protein